MFPRSTAKLNSGDFCFIARDSGGFVPFAVLSKPSQRRSYFYGGILHFVVDEPCAELLPAKLEVSDYALVHVHCFEKNNTPIAGNIADRIGSEVLATIEENVADFTVGSTSRVWGHRTILKYAEKVEV